MVICEQNFFMFKRFEQTPQKLSDPIKRDDFIINEMSIAYIFQL